MVTEIGEIERPKKFRKDNTNTAAESGSLRGIGLRKEQGKFVAANPEGGIGSAKRFLESGCGGVQEPRRRADGRACR